MRELEVRCCCKPTKLLGWLPVREGDVAYRAVLVDSEPILVGSPLDPMGYIPYKKTVVHLPVGIISIGGKHHYALRSEETPIETLRRLPDFRENK